MSNQIVISSGAKVRNLDGVLTGTSGIVSSVPLGAANGVATLDSGGKVPVSQLPSSVVTYLGTWNAATNTPTLVNGTGDAGDMYICNVAGTVNFGAGPVTFAVGDWVLYGSGTWQKSNGQNGTVTSVGVSRDGDALSITGSPITTAGTINIGFTGSNAQYINGEGDLVTFPSLSGFVTDVTGTAPIVSSGGTTPAISIPAASSTVDGYLDNADWTTFNNKQNAITLTTTGTSGVSTLVGSTLNIPNYSTDLSGYVPYTGATANVNLGTFDLTADVITGATGSFASSGGSNTFAINHSSGSGIALNITKGGNGEGLYINKTSGSGNAATIIGTLNATTLVKSGGTSNQFLKADGSVDASAYITLASLSAGTGISYNNTTGVITSTITQYTDALARAAISLTTTGTSGSSTYNNTTGVLNVPTYTLAGLGGVPTTRNITINGLTQDLSADRTWTITAGISSVSGTAPISVSTVSGAATVSIATANTSTTGALTSTDWNTFNGKQNALTNPVTGTGTDTYIPRFYGSGSLIGNSSISEDATNVTLNSRGLVIQSNLTGGLFNIFSLDPTSMAANVGGGIGLGGKYTTSGIYTTFGIIKGLKDNSTNDDYAGYLSFLTRPNLGSFTERLRITSDGNLLVDTITNAGYKLDVNGSVRFSSNFYVSGGTNINVGNGIHAYYDAGYAQLQLNGVTGSVIDFSTSATDYKGRIIYDNTANSLNFHTNSEGTPKLSLASNGSATFSASIQAGGLISTTVGDTNQAMRLTAATGFLQFTPYYDSTYGAFINSLNSAASAYLPITIQGSKIQFLQGTVLIGTTSNSTGSPSFHIQNKNGLVASIAGFNFSSTGTADNANNNLIISGGYYNGSTAVATQTSASTYQQFGGNHVFYGNESLTAGVAYSGTERFRIHSTGVITIGASTGVSGGGALQVNGNVNINGVFQINGVTIGGGGGSGITGAGTTNYIPKYSSSTSIGNSVMYDNGTNIGIGTTSPTALLHLVQNSSNLNLYLQNTNGSGKTWAVNSNLNGNFNIHDTTANRLTISSVGNIGIGNATPPDFGASNTTLTINGVNAGILNLQSNGTNGLFLYSDGSGTTQYETRNLYLRFGTNNSERLRISSAGNLLINTISDSGYKINLNGSIDFAYGFTNVFRGSSGPNDILVGNTGSTFYVGGSVTATGGFFDTSDSRLKILVKDYEQPKGIENVAARMYVKNNRKELGYYAQDLQEILPSAVSEGSDGFLTLSYSQVHTAKIAHLEKEIAELKALIKQLL
jgi:hypothetical protein